MPTLNITVPSANPSIIPSEIPVPVKAVRPVTSKARGVCKYYTHPRGCYAKDKCKFLHSEPPKEGESPILTPYDSSKTCRFYAQGYCIRGDQCWFKHTDAQGKGDLEEDDDLCSICFEQPTTYGLLTGCSHVFCITCIKQWRDPKRRGMDVDSANTKRCPMCRAPSKFITPSSKFWRDGSEQKIKTVQAYRESMSKVQCQFFNQGLANGRLSCPFGKDCFYQHKKLDGTLYEFPAGVEGTRRRNLGRLHRFFPIGEIPFIPGIDLANLTIGTALDYPPNLFTFDLPSPLHEGHSMEAERDMINGLRRHFRNVADDVGSNLGTRNGGGVPTGALVISLLDAVRDRLFSEPGLGSTDGPSDIPPVNSTRNGTASVADEAGDEPSRDYIQQAPPANGYESDNSIPGLRSVSNSSASEDDHDTFGPSASYTDLDDVESFYRHLFGSINTPNDEDSRTPGSRPASSARFSTVVDRSNATSSSTTPGSQVNPLLTFAWAEAFRRANDDDDDDPSHWDDMPPLEPLTDQPPSQGQANQSQDPTPPDSEASSAGDELPALELIERLAPVSLETTPIASPGGETSDPHTRNNEQDFTTDGRGRVISIGGSEHPTEMNVASWFQSVPLPRSSRSNEGSMTSTTPIQRQASEFTTDGRGRVISVGDNARDPVRSAETPASTSTPPLATGSNRSETREDDYDQYQRNGSGGGLFAWFHALF